MKITWLGHSCFVITNAARKTVLTDPFDDSVGYPLPKVHADAVTMSHHHHDHDALETLLSFGCAKDSAERETLCGFAITGVPTFHDDEQGSKRGNNTVFLIEADGVRVAHLGDLGHMLTDAQIDALGRVDVLLIPVGGFYTIDCEQAARIAKRIGARFTVPMHYKTRWMNFPITDETAFTQAMGARYAQGNTLDTDAFEEGTWVLRL